MTSPLRLLASTGVVLVVAGMVLGLFPPALGDDVPPTVLRTVALDERRLVPEGGQLLPGLTAPRRTWTPEARVCAPFRFTMVAFVWEQDGDAAVRGRLAWGGDGLRGRTAVVADPDEGPDPHEDQGITGTPPVWTGEARCARVSLRLSPDVALRDVEAVFINTSGTSTAPSFLDRAGDALARAWGMTAERFEPRPATAMTGQPPIITRAGWGAKEKMRRCGPDYAPAAKMAFVHHTVNSNAYSRSRADDLIRGIYAYHVRSRKFCDIAYNFLIDRFGRIYEGRFGGIEQPVVGAHAMGFNTGSVGVAALGDFTRKKPPKKVIKAYRKLLAWRLDVAHVRPTGTARMTSAGGSNTKVDKNQTVTLAAISGHRDTGYTTCPGARLYAKLGAIRRGAEARGLPKIWAPLVSPNPAPPGTGGIRFTAELSRQMTWEIEIANTVAPGTPYRTETGTGTVIDWTWDRKPSEPDLLDPEAVAPPGTYTVTFSATAGSATARPATLFLTIQ